MKRELRIAFEGRPYIIQNELGISHFIPCERNNLKENLYSWIGTFVNENKTYVYFRLLEVKNA